MSGDFPMFHTCDKVGSWSTIIVDAQIDVWTHYSKHCLTLKVIGKCWWGMHTSFMSRCLMYVYVQLHILNMLYLLINWYRLGISQYRLNHISLLYVDIILYHDYCSLPSFITISRDIRDILTSFSVMFPPNTEVESLWISFQPRPWTLKHESVPPRFTW